MNIFLGKEKMTKTIFIIGLILISFKVNYMEATIFNIDLLSEDIKQDMRSKRTWKEDCPVGLDRLRILKFSYHDFEGKEHDDGEMMVLDAVSEQAISIFKELYGLKFPLSKARRIEHYDGNDETSMADNNSSCFNCREITGGGLPSLHSYGLAIDINPIQNPYIGPQELEQGIAKVLPPKGLEYLNRTNIRPGMVENEDVIDIFKKHGFTIWGGKWNNPIDWQHFQPSRAMAQLLATMISEDAHALFNMYTHEAKLLNAIDPKKNEFVSLYQKDSARFMDVLKAKPEILKMEPSEAYSLINE